MKKAMKLILQVIPYFFFLLAIALIVQIVISLNQDKTPTIFGTGMFLVVSPSMEDTIMTGDLIFVDTSASEFEVGDIITFYQPGDSSVIITHRIIEIKEVDGELLYTTRGDNNGFSLDWEKDFEGSFIIGKYISKSATLGKLYHFVFTGRMNFLYAIIVLVFFMIAITEVINIVKTISLQKQKIYLEEREKQIAIEKEKLLLERKQLDESESSE